MAVSGLAAHVSKSGTWRASGPCCQGPKRCRQKGRNRTGSARAARFREEPSRREGSPQVSLRDLEAGGPPDAVRQDRLQVPVRQGGSASNGMGPGSRRRGLRSGGSCPRHGHGHGVVHAGGREPGRWTVIARHRCPDVACLDVIPAPRLLVKNCRACLDRGAGPFAWDRRTCVSRHWHPVRGPAAPSVSRSSGGKGRR